MSEQIKNDKWGGITNYSFDEQYIGTWIDGRPIYQKTLIINKNDFTLKNKRYQFDLSTKISDIDPAIIDIQGFIKFSQTNSGAVYYHVGEYVVDSLNNFFLNISLASTMFYVTVNDPGFISVLGDSYVTVVYLKNNDSVSGIKTTNFGDIVKYSLDEQLIGHTEDGSLLYQKTVDIQASQFTLSNYRYSVNSSSLIPNYKEIIYNTGYIKINFLNSGGVVNSDYYHIGHTWVDTAAGFFNALCSSADLIVITCHNISYQKIVSSGNYVTFRYTKTTD